MIYKLPKPVAYIHDGGQGRLWWDKSVDADGEYKNDDVELFVAGQMQAAYKAGLADGAPKWLPIESAPKNETEILLMYMHIETQIVHNGFWLDDEYAPEESGWHSYDKSEVSRIKLDAWMTPTHWMPLPAAPEPKP